MVKHLHSGSMSRQASLKSYRRDQVDPLPSFLGKKKKPKAGSSAPESDPKSLTRPRPEPVDRPLSRRVREAAEPGADEDLKPLSSSKNRFPQPIPRPAKRAAPPKAEVVEEEIYEEDEVYEEPPRDIPPVQHIPSPEPSSQAAPEGRVQKLVSSLRSSKMIPFPGRKSPEAEVVPPNPAPTGTIQKVSSSSDLDDTQLVMVAQVAQMVLKLKGKVFIMSRMSMIGLIFGLVLTAGLFFSAGFFTAVSMNPSGELAQLNAIERSVTPESEQGLFGPVANQLFAPSSSTGQKDSTAVKPGPEVAADGNQQFSIEVGSMTDLKKAKAQAEALDKKGYGSYLVRVPQKNSGNGTLYSVRLGVFGDYLDAINFSKKMQGEGHQSAKVTLIRKGEDRFVP